MQILTAVNDLLRAVGESQVTALTVGHPLEDDLTAIVLRVAAREQNQGWWFNQYYKLLPAELDGTVPVPAGTVKVLPKAYQDRYLIQKGLFVFDKNGQTDVIGRDVPAILVTQWDFEDLPESFAEYVSAMAQIVAAESYNADPLKLQSLTGQLAIAKATMHKEHVQNAKVNMLETASMGTKLQPAFGNRYAKGMTA